MDEIRLFLDELGEVLSKDTNLEVKGVAAANGNILSLATDSKILGRIFELFSHTVMNDLAKKYGITITEPQYQNHYPDFTIEKDGKRVALDIKSTYRNKGNIKFTLGSYGSYMRNNTKNIHYPYDTYSEHWVMGFVYDRNEASKAGNIVGDVFEPPYRNVEVFIQEKYKIASDKTGSGNTENIGSITTKNINDFVDGNGPFTMLGKKVLDDYWKQYPRYKATAAQKEGTFKKLDLFLESYNN